MVEWRKIELRPLFDLINEESNNWPPDKVLRYVTNLSRLVLPQLTEYSDGKYRRDRNEARAFFEAINKFTSSGLPIALDHFQQIVSDYKQKISPYPHYSGIEIIIPKKLEGLADVENLEVPDDVEDEQDTAKEEDSDFVKLT